ncbi:MAG: phosphoenolpyruvate--protein phosphotransferase [Desulfobacteraceae bacterium]
MSYEDLNKKFFGKTISSGLGCGRTFIYQRNLWRYNEFQDIEVSEIEPEVRRFELAVAEVLRDLKHIAEQVAKEIDEELSAIFQAHMAMVSDKGLNEEVKKRIRDDKVSAGSAVSIVFGRWEQRFSAMEAEIAREKADDIHDLAQRLVLALAGVGAHELKENLPRGAVLVTNRLMPSDTIFLTGRKASAVVLETGGKTSHAALFAREMGLPCISGIHGATATLPPGQPALVDADEGMIVINPGKKEKYAFRQKQKQIHQIKSRARLNSHKPAITRSGKTVSVFANVGHKNDVREAIKNGADGIGLFRLENIYLGRQGLPDYRLLLKEVEETLFDARHLPVFVRLLDIGTDKPFPFKKKQQEYNPSLGRRGIRFLLEYPELLLTQLEVFLQLTWIFDLHVLVPMVTLPSDMQRVKNYLEKAASQAQAGPRPKLGAMIETPAAALSVPEISKHSDFLSFGTNDLTQYTLAADRENGTTEAYFDDTHEAIFRLLEIAGSEAPQTPLSICGELAGREEALPAILNCCITTLSVVPTSIPGIKEAVRRCD